MIEAEYRLTAQEERDLNKFQKFFSFKFVQVIVQSRLGERITSSSKPNAMGYDWFNLAINDIQEVLEETKKITANNKLPSKNNPLCVEVSLRTNEGTTMVLETWRLGMNDKCENANKISYAVYNRMGVLLKSLIAVSRVTPAYKIARKQGHDYILCYRIYFGKVRVAELGEGYQSVCVGTIGTPRGGITLSVTYRTKLALPRGQSQSSASPLSTPDSPHLTTMTDSGMQYPVAMTAEFRHHIAQEIASAVADTDLSGSNLSPKTFDTTMSSSISTPFDIPSPSSDKPPTQDKVDGQAHSCQRNERQRTFSETCAGGRGQSTHGAFASLPNTPTADIPTLSSTPPFATLLSHKNTSSSNKRENPARPQDNKQFSDSNTVNNASHDFVNSSQPSVEDDFIIVELKAAFAPDSSPATDLTQFYRECQNAPALDLFQRTQAQPFHNVMETFNNELDTFERNTRNFDEFIDQLQDDKMP